MVYAGESKLKFFFGIVDGAATNLSLIAGKGLEQFLKDSQKTFREAPAAVQRCARH